MSEKKFSIEELIEHCERQKKRMGAMCVNSSNILLLEHMDTAEYLKELKEYKDAEEQGLLIRLPCKVGDIVYQITRNFISTYRIRNFIHYNNGNIFFDWECINGIYVNVQGFRIDDVGKTVFLTREEAEAALERMSEKENENE